MGNAGAPNSLVKAGGLATIRLAVLLTPPATVVCVVLTPEVVLGLMPNTVLVTANVTVQLPFAGMAMPLKLNVMAPAASAAGVVPIQVPPTAPPTALMFVRVSVKAPPVSGEVLLLDRANVTTELPPD